MTIFRLGLQFATYALCFCVVMAAAGAHSGGAAAPTAAAFSSACGADADGLFAPLGQRPTAATTYGVLRFDVRHRGQKPDEIFVLIRRHAGDAFAEYDPIDENILHDVISVSCNFKDITDVSNVALGNERCPVAHAPTVVDRGDVAQIVSIELTKRGLHVLYDASTVSLSIAQTTRFRNASFVTMADSIKRVQVLNGRSPQLVAVSLPATASQLRELVVGPFDGGVFIPTSRVCW